jgi:ribosomal protein S18 acetylase RimI-like enzyme
MSPTAGPLVRLPYKGELAALAALYAACFPAEAAPAARLARFLRRDPARDLDRGHRVAKVLEVEGRPAGVLLYRVGPTTCRVHRLGVHPELRRRGHGTLLLASVAGSKSLVRRPYLTAWVPERAGAALCFFRDLTLEGRPFVFRGVRRDGRGELEVGYRLRRPGCRARRLRVG